MLLGGFGILLMAEVADGTDVHNKSRCELIGSRSRFRSHTYATIESPAPVVEASPVPAPVNENASTDAPVTGKPFVGIGILRYCVETCSSRRTSQVVASARSAGFDVIP